MGPFLPTHFRLPLACGFGQFARIGNMDRQEDREPGPLALFAVGENEPPDCLTMP
jgi:hypothetical protein